MKLCCCHLPLCHETRDNHVLGNSFVPFPWESNEDVVKETCSALNISDISSIGENSRIWIGHYHDEDIGKKLNGRGYVVTFKKMLN